MLRTTRPGETLEWPEDRPKITIERETLLPCPFCGGRVMPDAIEPGDHVHHHPTGEDWVVRYVKGDRLSWLGWPPGEAMLADCTLIRKADDETRLTATPPAQPADSLTPSNKE